jgi:hypothetical protein
MGGTRKAHGGLLVAIFGLVLAGCGSNAPDLPVNEAPKDPVWVETGCPVAAMDPMGMSGGMQRGGVPGDFVTVAVTRCRTETRDIPGEGQWLVQIEERAETPATDVVAMLRKPSDPRTGNPCPTIMVVPPYFILVNAEGKGILPAIPSDGCGLPRNEVGEAVDRLPFKPVTETRLHQVKSRQSQDSDCSDTWKDELAMGVVGNRPGPAAKLWPEPSAQIRACVYQAAGDVGNLVSVHTVPADRLAALDNAGPGTTSCQLSHTKFAVLRSAGSGAWAVVELDGCYRLVRPDRSLGQLDASTAEAITK